MTVIKTASGSYFKEFGTFAPVYTKNINEAKKFKNWYDSECLDICNMLEDVIAINIKE